MTKIVTMGTLGHAGKVAVGRNIGRGLAMVVRDTPTQYRVAWTLHEARHTTVEPVPTLPLAMARFRALRLGL